MRFIWYKGGYKYQLAEDYEVEIPFGGALDIVTQRICIQDGKLLVRKGYCWDGPSGPVLNRRSTMRAALVHDALYQLMRQGFLLKDVFREPADKLFETMCVEDGVWKWLARVYYGALRRFGDVAASSRSAKRVERAP